MDRAPVVELLLIRSPVSQACETIPGERDESESSGIATCARESEQAVIQEGVGTGGRHFARNRLSGTYCDFKVLLGHVGKTLPARRLRFANP